MPLSASSALPFLKCQLHRQTTSILPATTRRARVLLRKLSQCLDRAHGGPQSIMGAHIRRRPRKLVGAKMAPKPNPEDNSAADRPIAWRAVPEDTAVRSDGQQVGTLYDLLGSDEEDIFHGIVVQLRSGSRRVFVPADDVILITASHVDVSLSAGEIAALPEHTEERQFELGMVGHLRKHLGWVEEKDR